MWRWLYLILLASLASAEASGPGTAVNLETETLQTVTLQTVTLQTVTLQTVTLQSLPSSVARFQPLAFTLPGGAPADPYDPATTPEVRFTSPSGETLEVAAFWYQDFTFDLKAKGAPHWQVRFTPTETGEWTVSSGGVKATVTVTPSESHGFLRVAQSNPRYLAYDDETPFFAIGLNLGWASSKEQTLADYKRWFDALAEEGANTVRVWMAAWSFGLEWQDTGLGNYSGPFRPRLATRPSGSRWPKTRGIYLILVLIKSRPVQRNDQSRVGREPLQRRVMGGPCNVACNALSTNETG